MSMRFNRLSKFALIFVLLLPVGLTSGESALAQTTEPSTKPADVLTAESINLKIKQLQEQEGLDEAIKTEAIKVYNSALGQLPLAAELIDKTARINKQRAEASGTVEEIRATLEKPIPEPEVSPPEDAKLEDLEKELTQREAVLKTASDRLKSLEDEIKAHEELLPKIPERVAKATKDLEDLNNTLTNPGTSEEAPELAAARRVERAARRKTLEKELEYYQLELQRTDLLKALRDQAKREVAKAEKVAKVWQEKVNDRRRVEVEAAAEAAKSAEQEAKQSHPVVAKLATEIAELAKERTKLATEMEQVAGIEAVIQSDYATIIERRSKVQERVERAGLSPQLALQLRRFREQLPNVRDLRRRLENRRAQMATVETRQFELSELILSDEERDAEARERATEIKETMPVDERERIRKELKQLLKTRVKYAKDLKADYDKFFDKLLGGVTPGLVDQQQELVRVTEEFAAYINENILWIRSTKPPQFSANDNDAEHFLEAFRALIDVENWTSAWKAFIKVIDQNSLESAAGGLLFLVLFSLLWKLRGALRTAGQTVSKSYSAVFTPTVESVLVTFVIAAIGPSLLFVIGWMVGMKYNAPDFTRALSSALMFVAVHWFGIAVLRQTCIRHGLAEAHFNWPTRLVKRIRHNCSLLILIGLPCVFVVAMMDWLAKDTWQRSMGRTAFLAAEIILAVFLYRVLHPVDGALAETNLLEKPGWKRRFVRIGYYAILALPIGLSILALMGYYYTALEIAMRFQRMIWLSIGAVIVYSFGLRWLLVSRRKLAIVQARQRRAAREAEQIEEAESEASDKTVEAKIEAPPEPEVDLSSMNVQTRAILRGVVLVTFIVGLWFVWVDVVPALRYFDKFELWTTMRTVVEEQRGPSGAPISQSVEKNIPVTLGDLGLGIIILVAALLAVRNLPGLLEIGVLRKTALGAGERYAIVTISKYVIMVVGLVGAFNSIGVGWSQVQWLAAAMTVGLGFGLQEIFANFVSGLIILFERPIRVGDVVTVGGVDGRVARIQMRATTVMNWDRKELIIPNKEFVTGQVINWTLSDEVMRIQLPVGIAYGSDTRTARDLLMKVAKSNPRVLNDPEPRVIFSSFGASSLDFELRCHVANMEDFVAVKDTLHYEIDDAFRKAKIEIAFPQMDIHLRDVPRELQNGRREMIDAEQGV